MLESEFRKAFLEEVQNRIDPLNKGFLFFLNASNAFRSFPDIVILGSHKWAALEFKKSKRASHQPNQEYYINKLNEIGYASFVYPENAEEILNDLEELF